MAETLQGGRILGATRAQSLVRAAQVAREAEVQQSANGVRWATFGETGVPVPDLDRMLEAVPSAIVDSLGANTYFFVPLAMREADAKEDAEGRTETASKEEEAVAQRAASEAAMVAPAYSDEFSDAAICHRNVALDKELGSGHRGVFISTRLLGDRFALSFEFFINVAHALVDASGVPERFAELAWKQVEEEVRGETSYDAWESRNAALGRPADFQPVPLAPAPARRNRSFAALARPFSVPLQAAASGSRLPAETRVVDEKEKVAYLEAAFSDAVAVYLLSLALDFDYSELREREYPLLAPAALAARLRLVGKLYPPNAGYEFSVRYKRRA